MEDVKVEASHQVPFLPVEEYGNKIRKLGSGVYGVVNLYKDSKGDEYAIKKMGLGSEGTNPTTLREIACLLRLDNENVIKLLDIIPTQKVLRIVLPFANGGTLHAAKRMYAMESELFKKKVAYQIISGVSYSLSKGVINRDLKPDNILIFTQGGPFPNAPRVVIADFGLARSSMCSFDSGVTKEVYTRWYRPPEVLLGSEYDDSADTWALGCLLYELWTGEPLFPEDTEYEMIRSFSREFGDLTKLYPEIVNAPNWNRIYVSTKTDKLGKVQGVMRNIIEQMLSIDPSLRPNLVSILNLPYWNDIHPSREKGIQPTKCSCISLLLQREFPIIRTFPLTKRNHVIISEAWLVEVARMFKLTYHSLFLAFDIFEQVAREKELKPDVIQKYVSLSLAIASKYVETYSPEYADYAHVMDIIFTDEIRSDFVQTELDILRIIKYDLFRSTPADFLSSYFSLGNYPEIAKERAKYIMIVLFIGLHQCQPHDLATAALYLSCEYSQCSFRHINQMSPEVMRIVNTFDRALKQPSLKDFVEKNLRDITHMTSSKKVMI